MSSRPRLGIIAGGGELPARLVEACRRAGRGAYVVAIQGHTDPATVEGVEHVWVRLGAASSAIEPLRAAGVEELVLAGRVKRPSLAELRPNLKVAQFIAKVGRRAFGDDGLLRAVIGGLEEEGFRVIGVEQIMNELLAERGAYGALQPDEAAWRDIERGLTVARALGAADVGQSVVVQQGVVLGVEAIEGTDSLLRRCAGLRLEGPGGILVKISKPGQEPRADLPTIGVATVEAAAAAGLRGIAIEAGAALVVDRAAVV
ncbi:MAG: LpxI family protein, partial [Kiloniellales bacterium]